jgi:outer membrane usher protein
VANGFSTRLAGLVAALLCGAALAQGPSPADRGDHLLPLEVIVNGAKSGSWVLIERGGELFAPLEAFEEWRVQFTPEARSLTFRDREYRALSGVPGFRQKLDLSNQSVELLFSPEAFTSLRLTKELVKKPVVSPVLPSVFFNYDASFTLSNNKGSPDTRDLGVLSELGLSTQLGVLTNSGLARNLTGDSALGVPREYIRLETTFTRDFPESNLTLRIGDTVTRTPLWGRDLYFGGVRFGTNFSLTPGFVSHPLPALTGVSAAPSTVELYVNDVLRQVSNVPTGPFVIDNFPQLTGSGEARVVVRDLLGRETVVVQPFFTTPQLLAAGLDDWSVEAGRVRRDLGLESALYGDTFAAGTWRSGLNRNLTMEGRVEVSSRQQLLGVGLMSALPWPIVARAALVGSNHERFGSGGRWLLGFEGMTLNASASVEASHATRAYRELAMDIALVSPVENMIAGNFMYSTGRFGALGAGFAAYRRYDGTKVSSASANYSVRVGERGSLTITASRAFEGDSGSFVGLTFILPLDEGRMANATMSRRSGKDDAYVAAVQSPGATSDLGWRVLAGIQQNHRHAEGGVYYQGNYGTASADASASPESSTVRVGASGGLVFAAGSLFATRRVDESFAVAEVEGYGNVPIGTGGTPLARTDNAGVALVPRLIPYMGNAIRLDPASLPISAEIDSIEQTVVPPWRSGVKVVFPVRSGRGALLRIVFEDGQAAPAGAVVSLEGDKEEFYVARRGEAFVTGLKPDSRVRLRWKDAQCALDVRLPPESPDEVARVGPLTCKGVGR